MLSGSRTLTNVMISSVIFFALMFDNIEYLLLQSVMKHYCRNGINYKKSDTLKFRVIVGEVEVFERLSPLVRSFFFLQCHFLNA